MSPRVITRFALVFPLVPLSLPGLFGAEISKLSNATQLDSGAAWNGGVVPGAGDVMLWDSSFTSVGNPRTAGVLSAQGSDLSVSGLKVTNAGGTLNTANIALGITSALSGNLLTIGSAGINMSTATQALYIESKVAIGANQTWAVTNANTGGGSAGFNNGEDLAFRALTAASASTANTPFTLGGNTVTTSGTGTINISSGYAVSGGTINVGNSLFIFSGGDTRAITLAGDVNLNVATGATLHFQSNSGLVNSAANIGLNGGTLKLVSNNATQLVTLTGTTTVNSASTLLVGNNVGNGSVLVTTANSGVIFNANLAGSAPLAVTNNASTANALLMGGNNSAYTGTLTFGGTAGRLSRLTTANSGSAAATWNIGQDHTLQLNAVNVNLGTLAGTGTLSTSAAGTSVATVGAGTFGGLLTNGTGTLALTKNTAATLTLTGANTYTGTTQIDAGTLLTTPAQTGSSTVNIANGATFGINLQTAGTTFTTTTLNAGATGANTILLNTNALGNPTAPVIATSTFNPQTGTVLKLTGSALAVGSGIPLVSYTTLGAGGFAALSANLPTRTLGTLVNNTGASRIDLNITSVEQAKWSGTVNGNWDADTDGTGVNGTQNWKTTVLGTATKYLQGTGGTDVANFDDSAAGTHSVNLTTTLTPNGVNVSGNSNYAFTGSGKISGLTALTKTGNGTLTIANTTANDFSGGTSIEAGGKIALGDGITAGAGVIAGLITNNGTLVLNHPEDNTFAATLAGAGTLQKDQANTVTVSAATTVASPVQLNAGTLKFSGGGNLSGPIAGSANLENSAGTLQLSGAAANTNNGTTTVSGGLLQLNKTAGTNAVGGNVVISGTGQLSLLAGEQIPDTASVTLTGTSTDSIPVQTGLETINNLTVNSSVAGAAGGQVVMRNGFTVLGTATLASGVLGVASGQTATLNGVTITSAPGSNGILRVSGNSGASTLNIGPGGITASGGEIQVKFNTNAQDAVLNLGGDFTATGNVIFTNAGYTGPNQNVINLTATRNFNIAAGTTTTVDPDIAGPGGLTKQGAGTLALTTLSTGGHAGNTDITAGTISLSGSASLPNTPSIMVRAGAALDLTALTSAFNLGATQLLGGKGTVMGAITTTAGAKISPGESPGVLTFTGAVDLTNAVAPSGSGAMIFELATPFTSDQALVTNTGSLNIGTGGLNFDDFSFTTLPGFAPGTYVLWDTQTPIIGTLGTSLSGTVGGLPGTLAFADGTNDLVLSVVPEPSSLLLGMAGFGLLARRRRHSA